MVMHHDSGKDSIFSSDKPKKVPRWYIPVVIGIIIIAVIIFNS